MTSLGERGADTVIGVIYPPQVAIVGFGRIAERPWVADGRVKKRPLVSVSLAADHRASDGHHRRPVALGHRPPSAGARQAMSETDIRAVVFEELGNIAPEADLQALDPKADLREALDIDSMDILNFVTAIHKRLGINIPETRLSQADHACGCDRVSEGCGQEASMSPARDCFFIPPDGSAHLLPA